MIQTAKFGLKGCPTNRIVCNVLSGFGTTRRFEIAIDDTATGRFCTALGLLVVTELVGCSRQDLECHVLRWRQGVWSLILRFGSSVLISSREDAWYLVVDAITGPQLKQVHPLRPLAKFRNRMRHIYRDRISHQSTLRRMIVHQL